MHDNRAHIMCAVHLHKHDLSSVPSHCPVFALKSGSGANQSRLRILF